MQEMRAILLSIGFVLTMRAVSLARPYTIEHYDAHLALDLEHRSLTGKETILLRSTTPSVTEIELDADEIILESVRVGKKSQVFSQLPAHVAIHLGTPLQLGERLSMTLTFHGSPTKGLIFSGSEAYTVYRTSQWLVVNHEPSDLATLRLSLRVPAGTVVIGNGQNVSTRTVGPDLISEWNERRAIPDFVFGFRSGTVYAEQNKLG
jgi:aminopeptidase N